MGQASAAPSRGCLFPSRCPQCHLLSAQDWMCFPNISHLTVMCLCAIQHAADVALLTVELQYRYQPHLSPFPSSPRQPNWTAFHGIGPISPRRRSAPATGLAQPAHPVVKHGPNDGNDGGFGGRLFVQCQLFAEGEGSDIVHVGIMLLFSCCFCGMLEV